MPASNTAARKFPWFGSRAGRRYKLELCVLVVAKLAALTLLYFAFIAPQPRADISPGAVQHHLLDSAAAARSGAAR
ncbi:MAG: cytochrome oxidase putative small subunit CydP [Rudaea sp.]